MAAQRLVNILCRPLGKDLYANPTVCSLLASNVDPLYHFLRDVACRYCVSSTAER